MTVNPAEKRYGQATFVIQSATGGTRTVTATVSGGAFPGANLPSGTSSATINIAESSGGIGPPTGVWGVAAVRDNSDVAGDYNGPAAVLGYTAVGTGGTLPASVSLAVPERGLWRLVLTVGNAAPEAQDQTLVDTGGTSTEYHHDSDGNSAQGGLNTVTVTGTRVGGYCWRRTKLASRSYSLGGSLRYGHQFTITIGLDSGTYINPKALKVGLLTSTADGTPTDGVYRPTPSTAGAATTATINVDTGFSQALGGVAYFLDVAVNNTLGDAVTPAGEAPDFLASGTITGTTTSQRAWITFDDGAQTLSGFTAADLNRVRSDASDKTIGSGIFAKKDSGGLTTGVGSFRTSGYATVQDVFRRQGPTLTTDAIPFLEVYVFDAYGVAIPSTSFQETVRRQTDDVAENTQTVATDANGRVRWNYTLAATNPAFNRYVKAAAARQTGSHASTGPDNPASPPASFSNGNSDHLADYPAPYPAYPRRVRITGNAFAGASEPSVTTDNVYGVNSEILFEDIWTGIASAVALNVNGVPTGAGQREQQLGAGSLKAKLTTLINEGTGRVINLGEHGPKDVAGRNVVVTADNLFLRRALFNDSIDTVLDAGSSLSDAQTKLENSIGYNANSNSVDTIAPPTDPAALIYYLGAADTTAQRTTLSLTLSGSSPDVGFTGDSGNFGFLSQQIAFIAIDTTSKMVLTSEVVQSDPTLTRRFTIKIFRITADDNFVDLSPDAAPLFVVYSQPSTGAMLQIASGTATPIGSPPTPDWEFSVVIPTGVDSIRVFTVAKVNGSRVIGGSEISVQVGYTFDGVDFAVGLGFK